MKPQNQSVVNAFSVDVEDYFHAEALSACAPREEWEQLESRVENNTRRLLELMDRFGAKGTFFVVGWVAERFPGLVREIGAAGHEIACHSFWHRLVYTLTPEEFRADTRRAKRVIEDACGQAVLGYRAPTFSITRRSMWALEILGEEGFRYDSSIFPIRHDLYGIPDYARFPGAVEGTPLREFPISTFRAAGSNWPFGGGGYLRIMPLAYTHHGFRAVNQREGRPVIVYCHPWEVDPEQPRLAVKAWSRFRHYTNLGKMETRIAALLRAYAFAPIEKLLEIPRPAPVESPAAR